jgi:23S rRNA pseudouridine2605 synthase
VAVERLQKIIAQAGVTSRRKAEALITAGRVAVNGEVVRELGSKADPSSDRITLDGEPLAREETCHLLINKPRGVLCALRDRFGRPLITDLLGDEITERVFPAGRLDYDSEGLVLLTNDGNLMQAITRPGRGVPKVYEVAVAGVPSEREIELLAAGVVLGPPPEWRPPGAADEAPSRPAGGGEVGRSVHEEDGMPTLPCAIERIERYETDVVGIGSDEVRGYRQDDPVSFFRVTLHEGRKNQIRRMFALIDAPVRRLVRVAIGPLELADLPAGEYRSLTEHEVELLRREVRTS